VRSGGVERPKSSLVRDEIVQQRKVQSYGGDYAANDNAEKLRRARPDRGSYARFGLGYPSALQRPTRTRLTVTTCFILPNGTTIRCLLLS
jgi:hypothetical protein